MECKRLKFLLSESLKYGATESGQAFDQSTAKIRYIRITDISQGGELRDENAQFLVAKSAAHYDVKKGDILLARSGATVGKAFRYMREEPASFAGYLIRARINEALADGRFVYYFLQSQLYWEYIKSYYSQATIQNLNASLYGNIPVPSPELQQQQQIANFLDRETAKADALIAKYERLLELLEEKRIAMIARAVAEGLKPNVPMKNSGVKWIGKVPQHWSLQSVSMRYDVTLGKMLDEKQYTGTYLMPYLRVADVQWGKINTENLPMIDIRPSEVPRCTLQPGDLLVCEGGSYPGRSAIWDGRITPCAFQKALLRLRPREKDVSHPPYLLFMMEVVTRSGWLLADQGKSTIAHIPAEDMKRLRIPCPNFDEQTDIAQYIQDRLTDLNSSAKQIAKAIDLSKERRAALITAAVTGQIDVMTYKSNIAKEVA